MYVSVSFLCYKKDVYVPKIPLHYLTVIFKLIEMTPLGVLSYQPIPNYLYLIFYHTLPYHTPPTI